MATRVLILLLCWLVSAIGAPVVAHQAAARPRAEARIVRGTLSERVWGVRPADGHEVTPAPELRRVKLRRCEALRRREATIQEQIAERIAPALHPFPPTRRQPVREAGRASSEEPPA
jgi:hypothetical protein